MTNPRPLTPAFEDALVYAARLHANQARKGSDTPYISHLMSVAALVLEFGGSEEQVIAALLHDAIEDQAHGEPDRLRREIRRRFGDDVLTIVEGCTDTDQQPKPEWIIRKRRYIQRLSHEDSSVALVAIADKLHNARSMLADYRVVGDRLWSRFNAPREYQLKYLASAAKAVENRVPSAMLVDLRGIIAELEDPSCRIENWEL
jgi:(p)ppGpp synthase/HD superfamily hydrolase